MYSLWGLALPSLRLILWRCIGVAVPHFVLFFIAKFCDEI